jgi:molecular chaperone Hsp33
VARIRAWASFDSARLPQDTDHAYGLIGEGIFAILMDQGQGMTPYQGMTPLVGTSLADCAETYFAQSEQLPTRFALTSEQGKGTWRSGGIMVQQLPRAGLRPPADDGKGGASGHNPDSGATGPGGLLAASDLVSGDDAENWSRATMLLQTVTRDELIGPDVTPDTLLLRLFHEEQARVFDAQPVRFGCSCSAEKVEQAMSIYSAKDIGHMTTEAGKVTADCQFCGAHYEFAPETLGFEATKT